MSEMSEREREMRICAIEGEVMLRGRKGQEVVTISVAVGESFEVKLRGDWCQMRLASGGYKGRYSITASGECERLALGMEARPCEAVQPEQAGPVVLDQVRAVWVGKAVESRVPLASGVVRGVVREITDRGRVVLVYTPPLNQVPVIVSFPVERVGEVLALASVAA